MAKIDNVILERKTDDPFDWITLINVLLLIGIGFVSLYSATYDAGMSGFVKRQLVSTFVGIAIMFVIAFLPKRILKGLSILIYLASVGLLVAVLFFGISVYGTKGWLPVGGFTLQPAEFSKLGLLMVIAWHLSTKGSNSRNFRDIIISIILMLIPVGLILMQPDMGTATVLIAMMLGILFWAGLDGFLVYFLVSAPFIIITSLKNNLYFTIAVSIISLIAFFFRRKIWITIGAISIFIAIGLAAPIIYDNLMPHQQARINTFLNPDSDPKGSGYNVIQSILAVGSGGLTGKGYLQGSQTQLNYIPMQWTDFIFSVPTEEFGFIGGVIVIFLFALLIYRSILIASNINDKFYSLLIIGAVSIFIYHITINIGMAIGLTPVMGIPLPFLSYGGTFMLTNFALIGLIINAFRYYSKQKTSYS